MKCIQLKGMGQKCVVESRLQGESRDHKAHAMFGLMVRPGLSGACRSITPQNKLLLTHGAINRTTPHIYIYIYMSGGCRLAAPPPHPIWYGLWPGAGPRPPQEAEQRRPRGGRKRERQQGREAAGETAGSIKRAGRLTINLSRAQTHLTTPLEVSRSQLVEAIF